MIDWGVVAAFTGPLVAAIASASGWFAWLSKQREKRVEAQIREITSKLEGTQLLMQERIAQVEVAIAAQARHLDKQDDALNATMQAVARIEGRLAGAADRTITGP